VIVEKGKIRAALSSRMRAPHVISRFHQDTVFRHARNKQFGNSVIVPVLKEVARIMVPHVLH
jgi:hypothetical protein